MASLASAMISSSADDVAMAHVEKEGTGTTTNCSASCGARNGAHCGMVSSRVIVGTSITCSATTGSVTKNLTTSDNWSTICGTGTSIIGTGTKDSMFGSTVRRRTRACGPAQAEVAADPAELLIKDVEELGLPATGCLLAPWGVVLHVLHETPCGMVTR